MKTPFNNAWHWPDHAMGKRESRRLRQEHNALFNSHEDLREFAEDILMAFHEHQHHDLNDIPADFVINRAKKILANIQKGI